MRYKTLTASALAVVLVGATATAAVAVGNTFIWDQGTSTDLQLAANWAPDGAPGTDDNLVFPMGTMAAVNGVVDYSVRSLDFQAANFDLSGARIFLDQGITVANGDAFIANDLLLTDGQVWTVPSGSLQVSGDVDVDVSQLTIDNAAIVVLDGQLKGIVAGVLKTGTGVLAVRGGGLLIDMEVAGGTVLLRSITPNLGTVITGGTLAGGNAGNVGNSQALYSANVVTGSVSPGPDVAGNHGIGTLWLDGPFTAASGTSLVIDLDGATGDVLHSGDNVDLGGTELLLHVAAAPPVGTRFSIVEGNTFSPTFLTLAGVGTLADQATFVVEGHQFRIEYLAESVDLVYLGEALPATGLDVTGTVTLMALLLLVGTGAVLVSQRRRRTN